MTPTQDPDGRARSVLLATHPGVQQDAGLAACLGQWVLQGHGLRPVIEGEPEALTRRVAELAAEVDLVAAAGGDGTVRTVAQGIVDADADTPLAVLPMGTGNDLARQLGLTAGLTACHALLDEGRTESVDVGITDQGVFLNMLSVGFAARITAETPVELKQTLGGWAYLFEGVSRLGEASPFSVQLQAPDWSWTGDALGVFIANGRLAGGGRTVAPAARWDDGLLDVRIVRPCPPGELLALLARTAFDPGGDDPAIVDRRSASLEIHGAGRLPLNLDGEHAEAERLSVRLEPERLQLLGR